MTAPQEPEYLTATRTAYDTVAADYASMLADVLDDNPFDRAVLSLYVELARSAPAATERVVEIGCGPGRITGYLARLGLDIFGIDLSPAMIEQARRRHPSLEFRIGQMTALDLAAGSVAGLVAWYSIIHVPPAEHPAVFAEFRRVLAPAGYLLLAFHVGDECRHITDAYGHTGLAYDAYRLRPDQVEKQAVEAGFQPVASLVREPIGPEKMAQAYLLLRRQSAS